MNMNEVLDQIILFKDALEKFDAQLRKAWSEIEQRHAALEHDWQDDNQRNYLTVWKPLEEALVRYRTIELPEAYERIVAKECQARKYLSRTFS